MTTKRKVLVVGLIVFIVFVVSSFFYTLLIGERDGIIENPGVTTPVSETDKDTFVGQNEAQKAVSYPDSGSAEEILEMSINTEESIDADLEGEVILEDFSDDLEGMDEDDDFLLGE